MKNIYIPTLTDSYKFGHFRQYPDDTEYVSSYFEARNGAKFNKTVFFGLQYYLKEYLEGVRVTKEGIDWGSELANAHFGYDLYNKDMWNHILNKYGGNLPVRIKAVPEGTPVDVDNVMMTIVNTDPMCAPLTNHLETLLSEIWAPCTVATLSREVKALIGYYMDKTAESKDLLPFQLHDFGFRGVSSVESAGIEGAGHIVNFMGTDTVRAMEVAHWYYGAPLTGLAYSVAATEHSVMTALGREGEPQLVADLIRKHPTGILSIVIDSYDYRNFILGIAKGLKEEILARDGKTVFRPDSGDPVATTLDVLNMLWEVFGGTTNIKGYKVLNPKIGMLWGDGIDYDGIRNILFAMRNHGWSAENIVFGMGGGLLQKINRDTQRFAFKSSAQCRSGIWHDIFKQPLDVTKKSKKGHLALLCRDGQFQTIQTDGTDHPEDVMRIVFENGEIITDYTFDQVRANAA